MLPSERNLKTMSLILMITHINGVNTAANELFSLRHKLIIIFHLISFIPQINGLIQIWPDPVKVCHSFIMYVFAVQLLTVGFCRYFQNHAITVPEINGMVEGFYKKHEKDEEFQKILIPISGRCYLIIKWFIIFMFVLYHIPTVVTWTYTCITGEFFYIAPLYFPFLDPQSVTGYLINQTYMSVLITTVFISNCPLDIWYLYLTLQIIPMVENIKMKLKQLEENLITLEILGQLEIYQKIKVSLFMIQKVVSMPLKLNLNHQKFSSISVQKKLEKDFIKIIEEFKTYNNFVQRNLKIMKWSSCVTFSVSSIGIGMSIYLIMYSSVIIGLTAGVLFTVQVLIQCIQGSIILHQNEKILEAICGFPWYEMPQHQQKNFLQFIHVCQNGCTLKIPIIGKLNMELFTSVMNGAYSLLNYMLKFKN